MTTRETTETITSEQGKEIIELLEEIRDELKTLNEKETDGDYTCDQCDENIDGEPYKKVNKYEFCSFDCWDE